LCYSSLSERDRDREHDASDTEKIKDWDESLEQSKTQEGGRMNRSRLRTIFCCSHILYFSYFLVSAVIQFFSPDVDSGKRKEEESDRRENIENSERKDWKER
jgi:hypothetical protein